MGYFKVWQRDDVTTLKELLEKHQMLQILYHYNWSLGYNKGVSWRNKDASWPPYCIFKRNKDIHAHLYPRPKSFSTPKKAITSPNKFLYFYISSQYKT